MALKTYLSCSKIKSLQFGLTFILFFVSACSSPNAPDSETSVNPSSSESTAPPVAELPEVESKVSAPPKTESDKTLFAIYMIGGDLEDDLEPRNGQADEIELGKTSTVGSGSDDLREMVQAYKSLSANEKEHLNFWVGFGGARKQGWKGIKYADFPCLVKDAKDDYFGNDDCYAESHPQANMAAPDTLSAFLSFVKSKSAGQGRKIVELWDHGLAYMGMGNDTNFGQDLINLDEMGQAFKAAELEVDLLGFDACLMASLEVAAVAQPHAKYMVASEELEPGHGWDYQHLVQFLARQPKASAEAIGKTIVDSFIDSPGHQVTHNKTLSVLNLQALPALIESLPDFVRDVTPETFAPLLLAVGETSRVGVQAKEKLAIGIDLGDFASKVKKRNPEAQISALQDTLNQLIVYARQDGSKPNASGLAVYSLAKELKPAYGESAATVKPWADFAERFFNLGTQDSQNPVIQASQKFQTQQEEASDLEDYDDFCVVDGNEGHCYEISDDLGVASVEQIFSLEQEDGLILDIGADRLVPEADGKTYFATAWQGDWFRICSGPCRDVDDGVIPSAFYEAETEDETLIYVSPALLNDQDVDLYLEVDYDYQVLNQWAVPLIENEAGDLVPSRLQLALKQGDSLTFLYTAYDPDTDEEFWLESDPLVLDQEPSWEDAEIPDVLLYFVEAKDYQGNYTETPLYEVDALE